MGNLVPLLTLRRFQQAGHRPIVLVGGATGRSAIRATSAERTLQQPDTVADWVRADQGQIEPFVEFDGRRPVR